MPHPLPSDASDSHESSDRYLVTRLQSGHTEALGSLYDRYSSLVYTLALRLLGTPEEAEDLTQEIFLSLWQRQQYDPNRGRLSSFLVTLTRSRSLDRLRRRGTGHRALQRLQGLERSSSRGETPLEQVSFQERSQRIRDALTYLSEAERQVLEIAYFEGLSQSQIATRLGIPLGTVKTRSRQGLLKLRQFLHPDL